MEECIRGPHEGDSTETPRIRVHTPRTERIWIQFENGKIEGKIHRCLGEGSLRRCYEAEVTGSPKHWVVMQIKEKIYDNEAMYLRDLKSHALASSYAEKFNEVLGTKVKYVDAYLAWFDRENGGKKQFLFCEEKIEGVFRKYNNNTGSVSFPECETPQAFSHFTYVVSEGKHLVVDIQGVGDVYTDPQIHSADKTEIGTFGTGNRGDKGISEFFETHTCNSICKLLGMDLWRADEQNVDVQNADVQNAIRTYTGHQGPVYCCSLSPKGDRMVSGSKDGTVRVWDVKTADEIVTFNEHKGYVLFCVFHPTKNHILSCSSDNQIKIWEIDTGKQIFSLSGHSGKVYCCVYSPSGNEVASASSDETIRLWSSENGKKLLTLRGHTSAVFGVCFGNDPSQKMLCSASDDKTVKLWDWGEQKEVLSFQGHRGTVWSCMFSQNDSQILSASMDGTVKIWDTKAGTCYKTFDGHTSPVHCACFAMNDTRIVSGSRDKTLKVWEIESGRVLTTLMGHQLTVYRCSVFNSLILSCSSDGTLKVWGMK